MKKLLLFFAMVLVFGQLSAQNGSAWFKVGAEKFMGLDKVKETPYSDRQQFFQLNETAFRQSLQNAPDRLSGKAGVEILLPNMNGVNEKFLVWETSNFAPGLRAKYPEIKSYVGKGITDKTASLNFSVSPIGVQTMVFRADEGSEFIEAYTKDHSVYVLFDSKTRAHEETKMVCGTDEKGFTNELTTNSVLADNGTLKTFRLALSCTSEYTTFYGGTIAGALAGMNATMTRVNGVYERDLAVRLEIIENNAALIFTNAATDPYDNAVPNGTGDPFANPPIVATWNVQLQNTLTSLIGNGAYDIGHLFGASGGGGNAGCIGCVCVDDSNATNDKNKGSGFTSPSNNAPVGDTFDIDFVAHEMGHQLGANHTYSYRLEGAGVNVEPGSGSTIMAYAGVVDPSVQSNSDDYFTHRSILQIQTNLNNKTCSVNTVLTNNTPVANAGLNYNIPFGTAFVLKGSATDADGDALTYTWEQNDNATAAVIGDESICFGAKTAGPNFRSFSPTSSPNRYMPRMSSVLAGALETTWESVVNAVGASGTSGSAASRTLNFNLTVRDNVAGAGQTGRDAASVNVSSSVGPFQVTSQSSASTVWVPGNSENITWNVNNTTSLSGSANVNIKFSTDGGLTFPYTLASNVPNNGLATIVVPDVAPTTGCRILIEPTENIYFAVNAKTFSIGYDCNIHSTSPNASIPDGTSAGAGAVLTSFIDVPNVGTVNNMKINLNVAHTYAGDLIVRIKHPDGTTRILWNRSCNSAATQNIDVTFVDGAPTIVCGAAGTYRSVQTLGILNGKPTNGRWELLITDGAAADTGSLVSWGLDFGCTLLSNDDFNQDLGVAVYPNPNKGNFNVQFNNTAASNVNILVHDLRGRKIFENKYNNTGLFSQNIQLDNADSGIYLVTVQAGDQKSVKKIVVQ